MDMPSPASPAIGALLHADRARSSIYHDPALFDAEMHKVFESTWVWVAHASEIPGAGDFKTGFVGRHPVIVVRDRKGQVHVHVNRCRHRAATVCENQKGKTASFICPYHGWAYALDGSLRGVPYEKGYQGDLSKADYALRSLKVAEYNGLIFASFKNDIEPLEDFLGAARKWIDLFMKQGAGFGVKVLGTHKFRFGGNWKIQLENTTDAYHFPLVHKSFLVSLDSQTEESMDVMKKGGWIEDLGNGHSVMVMLPDLIDLDQDLDLPIPARFAALAAELAQEYSDLEVRRIVRAVGGSGFNLNLFPNVACSMAFFRVLTPIVVDRTEIHHVAIGMDGGPAAANRERMRLHELFQGPMGFGSPDDAEVWDRVQHGSHGAPDDVWLMLNRGVSHDEHLADGTIKGEVSSETGMRAAYRHYKRLMEA